jgi:tyrosine-protein kinase Etk/Wzc
MNPNQTEAATQLEEEKDINLLDVLAALGEEKLTFFVVIFLALLIGLFQSLTMTPVFAAKTSFLPAQQLGGNSMLTSLSGLSGLSSLSGLSGIGGVKTSEELYISFMRSASVQTALIQKLALMDRFKAKTLTDARMVLDRLVVISVEKKSGLISVMVEDPDPQFAAELANAQVAELNLLLNRMAVTEAQNRRIYFEKEVEKTQISLLAAELLFKQAQEKSGVQVMVSIIAESGIRTSLDLRAQIASREIQLQTLARYATQRNPDYQRLNSEMEVLKSELRKYEQGTGRKIEDANPAKNEAMQAFRYLKIQESKLDSYVRQLESARIDESKEGPPLQVLDVAMPSDRRSKPERKKMVTQALIVGLVLGLVLALGKALVKRLASSPASQQQWLELKSAWALGRKF